MLEFIVNRDTVRTSAPRGAVLMDVLRDELGLKGTKEGCREGDCGACTVLVGEREDVGMRYHTAASCLLPVGTLHGRHVVTIEGLNEDDLSPIQQAIVDEGATQCGFCTPGIVVALTGFLLSSTSFGRPDAVAAVEGNICRCTGYTSILRAVERLVRHLAGIDASAPDRVRQLASSHFLPAYFEHIPEALDAIVARTPKDDRASDAVQMGGGTRPNVRRVAGGTDLFVQQAERLRDHQLHFLDTADLQFIRRQGDTITIGAGTRAETLLHSDLLRTTFPCWERALRLVSSTLIRNRATLAGNIVNASPIGDLSILLIALDAHITIRTPKGSRGTSLDRFWNGYKTFDLADDEWITEIAIPVPPAGTLVNFEKVSRREFLDIAGVNTACRMTVNNGVIAQARLSAGGVAPIPLFLRESSDFLQGRPLTTTTLRDLLPVVNEEISPIRDVRGSDHYKRRLLGRLVAAHFAECAPDLDVTGVVL